MDCLSRQIGKNAVEQTRFRYMVTLPATWSPAAREATRQAAQNAGFGTRERDELISSLCLCSLLTSRIPVSTPLRTRGPQLRILNGHPIPNDLFKFTASFPILNGHPLPNDLFRFTSSFQQLPGVTRGRKPGSKVVNGKVIQPGTPGYDEAVADHRLYSQGNHPSHCEDQGHCEIS